MESQSVQQIQLQHTSSSESSSNHNKQNAASRPKIQVAPRGIGPVTDLHENDVLCGRGGRINGHVGNIQFRQFCAEKREEYFTMGIKKIQKAHIASSVVDRIRSLSPPGRFLKQDGRTGQWFDIGCAKAMTKVGQAIREHTPKGDDTYSNGMMGGFLGLQQDRTSQLAFNGPLYPNFQQPIKDTTQHNDQVPSRTVNSAFRQAVYQANPVAATSYGNNNASEQHPLGNNYMTPTFRAEKRLSTFSAMSGLSGLSRMSALMRSSVQSDLSDGPSPCASRRISRADSLLRQSVLSDISDSMSMMSLEDPGYSQGILNRSLTAQEEMGMGLQDSQSNDSFDVMLQGLQNNSPKVISESKAPEGSRWANRRASRKSSLFSLSMISTISMLSIGSAFFE